MWESVGWDVDHDVQIYPGRGFPFPLTYSTAGNIQQVICISVKGRMTLAQITDTWCQQFGCLLTRWSWHTTSSVVVYQNKKTIYRCQSICLHWSLQRYQHLCYWVYPCQLFVNDIYIRPLVHPPLVFWKISMLVKT